MNRVVKVYTELDSLYDYRRGLLSLLMTEGMTDDEARKAKGDELWDLHVAKNYKERRFDTFEYPFFGINRGRFDALYKNRSISDWLMYYPSNFTRDFIKTLVDLEKLSDRPIDIKTVELYVNTYPYSFDEELKKNFIAYCTTCFKGLVTVKLVDSDPAKHDALYYKQYGYVFKYDALVGECSKALIESLKDTPIPDTAFLVPDILVNDTGDFTGANSDLIFTMSVVWGTVVKIVPIKHQFFDYAEK